MKNNKLKEAVVVQFYPQNDQSWIHLIDIKEVKDRADPTHPKHDPIASQVFFDNIKDAIKDKEKMAETTWDIVDYAEECEIKLPCKITKKDITLYLK